MTFEPDILVTSEDSSRVLMIVEAKLRPTSRTPSELQLKRYMWSSRCPVGLVVHPRHVSIFRDSFRREDESAIEDVGTFPIPTIEAYGNEQAFEVSVQRWLESIQHKTGVGDWDATSWEAISEIVLPVLRSGSLRAAHPRLKSA